MTSTTTSLPSRHYADGPPACLQCTDPAHPSAEGGWSGLPTTAQCTALYGTEGCVPAVTGADSPFWLVLFVLWGASFLAVGVWALLRAPRLTVATHEENDPPPHATGDGKFSEDEDDPEHPKRHQTPSAAAPVAPSAGGGGLFKTKPKTPPPPPPPPSLAAAASTSSSASPPLSITFFRSSRVELLFIFLAVLNYLVLFSYYLILCVDFYSECQNDGTPDNMCYYGTFRIMGNYQRNSEAFFFVWLVMSMYCLVISVWWRELHDFVRRPATARDADVVRVVVPERVEYLSSGMPSFGMRMRRWVEAKYYAGVRAMYRAVGWRTGEGITATTGTTAVAVPVQTNELGERFFVHECARYALADTDSSPPTRISCTLPPHERTVRHVLALKASPLSKATRLHHLAHVGPNEIHLELPSIARMVAEEFLSPFYTYQVQIYLIWIWWTYWFVGICLLSIVVFSGIWSTYLKRKNLRAVHELAKHRDGVEVFLVDEGGWKRMSTAKSLVPGDLVRIQGGGWSVPADLALVQGNCAADEADLTGESMPQSKSAVTMAHGGSSSFGTPAFKAHTLFAGTKVLEASPDAYGVVLATGIDATRGVLLSHVLFPIHAMFRFDEEFVVAVGFLLVYALLIFVMATVLQASSGALSSWTTILAYCVFSVSQVVSPMLKIALVAGRVAASKRLASRGITVLDPQRIDIAGKVRVFCFDKTGTLTQEGLTLIGLLELNSREGMKRAMATCHSLAQFHGTLLGSAVERSMFTSTGWSLPSPDEVVSPMADIRLHVQRRCAFDQTTRTMSVVVTDPSQAAAAAAVGATAGVAPGAAGPLTTSSSSTASSRRTVTFAPVSNNNSTTSSSEDAVDTSAPWLYMKGAPEAVAARCRNVPPEFLRECDRRAAEGCYVLAVAQRFLNGPERNTFVTMPREELERDCVLLGSLIFRNEVKTDAAATVAELKRGHVRVVMVTGDNAPCAMYVAKELGMTRPGTGMALGQVAPPVPGVGGLHRVAWTVQTLPATATSTATPVIAEEQAPLTTDQLLARPDIDQMELCVTGEAFDVLRDTGELGEVFLRIRVFARTSPSQKVAVVREFVTGPQGGLVTAMAGDGGNDSGALRAAHVGLSVGGAEASVVAPFCAKQGQVWSCAMLLAEGRCSLATSLASYKLLVSYGLLFSIVKMASFYYAVLMPVMGYIFIDIVAVVPLTFAITLASPLAYLNPSRPTASLLGPATVGSLVGTFVIAISSMAVNLSVMTKDPGYVAWPSTLVDTAVWWAISDNYESTVIWSSTFLIFITCSLVYSFGSSHRASLVHNWVLLVIWITLFVLSSVLLLSPVNSFTALFHMASEPFNRVNTYSPVWKAYQALGGKTSQGMSSQLRWSLWGLSVLALLCLVVWERGVIAGPVGLKIKSWWRRWQGDASSQQRGFASSQDPLMAGDDATSTAGGGDSLADDEEATLMAF